MATTKKELREALQRLADATEPACAQSCQCARQRAVKAARAILARPAVTVGYRVHQLRIKHPTLGYSAAGYRDYRPTPTRSLDVCRDLAHDDADDCGGAVRKLVVR